MLIYSNNHEVAFVSSCVCVYILCVAVDLFRLVVHQPALPTSKDKTRGELSMPRVTGCNSLVVNSRVFELSACTAYRTFSPSKLPSVDFFSCRRARVTSAGVVYVAPAKKYETIVLSTSRTHGGRYKHQSTHSDSKERRVSFAVIVTFFAVCTSMASGFTVTLEYAQAFLMLIYYWFKALGRLLLVQKTVKSVENDIILVTGAGTVGSIRTFSACTNVLFFFRGKAPVLAEAWRNDWPRTALPLFSGT